MKQLGVIGCIAGGILLLLAFYKLFSEQHLDFGILTFGLVAILCGMQCIALEQQAKRLQEIERKLAQVQGALPPRETESVNPFEERATREQMVEELRRDGLLSEQVTASNTDIDKLIE